MTAQVITTPLVISFQFIVLLLNVPWAFTMLLKSSMPTNVTSLIDLQTEIATQERQRLHIISITGKGHYAMFSIIVQSSWEQLLGISDNYTNVCDDDCDNIMVEGKKLTHVLPMPDLGHPECIGSGRAQMKFVWGLIFEFKRIASNGGPMPNWWFVKDDDTYVHIDRLMDYAAKYNPQNRVLIANIGWSAECNTWSYWDINGGAGWLVSAALAEALVVEHGDQWFEFQANLLRNDSCYWYDQALPFIVDQVHDVIRVDAKDLFDPGFENMSPECPRGANLISLQVKKRWYKFTYNPYEMIQLTEKCFGISSMVSKGLESLTPEFDFNMDDLTVHSGDEVNI